jgi:hypothetical protein
MLREAFEVIEVLRKAKTLLKGLERRGYKVLRIINKKLETTLEKQNYIVSGFER